MPEYLVAASRPAEDDEDRIEVVDDVDYFSPGLLAAYPIETVCANIPEDAGDFYAGKHGLQPIKIFINTVDGRGVWGSYEEVLMELDE